VTEKADMTVKQLIDKAGEEVAQISDPATRAALHSILVAMAQLTTTLAEFGGALGPREEIERAKP